ncbi:MAG: hypothetical protein WBC83_01895 [Minisyncoccia bacterium]
MKKEDIHISKLLANPENPRFEPVSNQADAIELMLEKNGSEIKKLAEDIALYGLNPSKSLMVVEVKKNKFLPLEGNRRVVSIILLNDPSKTKNQKIKEFFEQLRSKHLQQIPSNLHCVIFPNKEAAFRWVNLEHTGKNSGVGVVPWDSEQRSRFIAQYSGENASKAVQIFDFADANSISRANVDPTTLDRLFSTPLVRGEIGIDFKKGILEIKKSKNEVLKNIKKVLQRMSHKDFKVGDVYTASQREEWITDTLGLPLVPTIKKVNTPATERSDKKPVGLFSPSSVPFKLNNRELQKLYDELKNPGILQFPNAAHDLLRSFLECSLVAYLKHKDVNKFHEMLREKNKKDGNQTLTNMLDYISKSSDSPITDQSVKDTAWQLISDDNAVYSVNRMNMLNHSENWSSDEKQVKEAWSKLESLFKVILNPKKK